MKTFFLIFVVWWRSRKEEKRVRAHFYSNEDFKRCDKALKKAYRWKNPFKISKHFLKEKGASDVYVYGETPLTTCDAIAKACGLQSNDTLLELGCGRGRSALFWAVYYGATVHGIDWIPAFIGTGRRVSAECGIDNLTLSCEDFIQTEVDGATVIYLFGTSLADADIQKLCTKFRKLSPKVRIITISYPLTEYDASFKVNAEFPVTFLWGETTAYLQSPHGGTQ